MGQAKRRRRQQCVTGGNAADGGPESARV